jgi:hypothetical protein
MKKILFTLVLGLLISFGANAQSKRGYRSENSGFKVSHGITLGGVIFSATGFITPPLYTSTPAPNSTSAYNFNNQKLPFYQQGPRAVCIVTGITLTVTGLITMLTGK